MKRPLEGSDAKAWTEFKIPDRTKKVPIKLSANVKIDNNTVQDCNVFLFSRIETQCIKADQANHGMRDAFSTGSQNQ